jgi:hypothetical protein
MRPLFDQPYDRAVVGRRRNAFLVDLQTLHPQIDDRFFQQGRRVVGVRVDAGVWDKAIGVFLAGVVEVP